MLPRRLLLLLLQKEQLRLLMCLELRLRLQLQLRLKLRLRLQPRLLFCSCWLITRRQVTCLSEFDCERAFCCPSVENCWSRCQQPFKSEWRGVLQAALDIRSSCRAQQGTG